MPQSIDSLRGSFKQSTPEKTQATAVTKRRKKPVSDVIGGATYVPPPPPKWARAPHPVRTLTEPVRRFVPGHEDRHRIRQKLHQKIYAAAELSRAKDKGSVAAWRDVVATCKASGLDLGRQIERCSGDRQHLLDMLLNARDYDALGVLEPALKHHGVYGRVKIIRSRHGRYIGEVMTREGSVKAHGHGHMAYANGSSSQGTFVMGILSGDKCVFTNRGGVRFEGPYKSGQPHGAFKEVCKNFTVECSPFKDGQQHGTEIARYANGDRAVITRKKGAITAFDHTTADGTHYEGEIDTDSSKYHGYGKQTLSDGSSYQGTWRMGEKHGSGTVTFGPEHMLFGYRYSGDFVNGEAHGYGKFENVASRETYSGFYRQGMLVGKSPPLLSDSDTAPQTRQANEIDLLG